MSKKILPLLFCLVIFSSLKSQSLFCPPGAQWRCVYNSFNLDPTPDFINVVAWNGGTTTINGEVVTILKHDRLFRQYNVKPISVTYLKEVGDTVFMKSVATNNQWCILFNFAATAGQTWEIPPIFSNATFTVTVDAVDSITLNGITLKRLSTRYKQSNVPNTYYATITERLGGSQFLFNFLRGPISDGDYMTEYLCYQDSALGLLQFSNKPCYYSNLTGISENYSTSLFKMYPNPSSDFITVDLANPQDAEAKIIDINGKELRTMKLENKTKVDVQDLAKGIYLLNVIEGTEKIYTTKFIKE